MASSGPSGSEGVFFGRIVRAWASGNRCGSERQVAWKGLEIAHNGVRGDDVVEAREASE